MCMQYGHQKLETPNNLNIMNHLLAWKNTSKYKEEIKHFFQLNSSKVKHKTNFTSWEGPSDRLTGLLFSIVCSHNFIALWSSLRCAHFGSLGNPVNHMRTHQVMHHAFIITCTRFSFYLFMIWKGKNKN